MFDAFIVDINGVARGARMPLSQMESAMASGLSWPRSLYAMRLDGGVVEETGLAIADGDPDYPCALLSDTKTPMVWRKDGMQAVAVMQTPPGEPFYADPRTVLLSVIEALAAEGYTIQLAVELEFYLTGDNHNSGANSFLYSLDAMDEEESFFDLLRRAAAAQNIELGATISEYASGQFEVNLHHQEPLAACLEAILFRRLVRGCARAMGKQATFMAKPYGGCSGNGMHMHLSLRDPSGDFCFADKSLLHSAVAGVLNIISESTLIFAPFANSYRRFVPGSYAPLTACWGDENRAAAVRLPHATTSDAARLEIRVAGADANPYLVAAALLAGAHWGIKNKVPAPPQMESVGNIAITQHAAMAAFADAKILPQYWDKRFIKLYHQVKYSEWMREVAVVSQYERRYYERLI